MANDLIDSWLMEEARVRNARWRDAALGRSGLGPIGRGYSYSFSVGGGVVVHLLESVVFLIFSSASEDDGFVRRH